MNTPLSDRVTSSFEALGLCWFVSGVALGFHIRDPRGSFAFFLWSLPIFAVGWIFVGIPVIMMGSRITEIPKINLGFIGAAGGACIMLLPTLVLWAFTSGTMHFKLDWAYLKGWPAFGAGNGAGGLILYSWLLSRVIHRTKSKSDKDLAL